MIFHLFRPSPHADRMTRLYGTIVAQARAETFYRDFGVPDTVNGRFEMIVLHAVLLLRRLDGDDTRGLGQALFDHFCGDMDGNLREMGIGDLGVPRQMRRIGEAFYGRKAAYGAALAAANDEALTTTLARNVFGAASAVASAERLAAYVAAAAEALAGQDAGALMRGDVAFPDPAVTMVRPEAAGERPGWDS